MVAFVCRGAKVLVIVGRGAICLARIRVGSAWIRKRFEVWVLEKRWFLLDGAAELARIHLDPEVCLFKREEERLVCFGYGVTSYASPCTS